MLIEQLGRHGLSIRRLIPLVLVLGLAACTDELTPRTAGAVCAAASQCESNLCHSSVCLEPASDDDLDGLTNDIEILLGTDPLNADTDNDGLLDGLEIGNLSDPFDEDKDGRYDALESAIVDEDNDCLSAQKEVDDKTPETDTHELADKACCCHVPCSALGIEVAPAACTLDSKGAPVISCPEDLEAKLESCDARPHSLVMTPDSPSQAGEPTLSGVAPYAASVGVRQGTCEGAVLVEAAGTGGLFQVLVEVDANTTTTLYVTTTDVTGAALGCSDPIAYTHDDTPPAAPTVDEAVSVGSGENMTVMGSSEVDTAVSLFDGVACQTELATDLELNGGTWSIDLAPALPTAVTANATDDAGNVSDCSTPLVLTPLATCTAEEMTVLQGSDQAGDTIFEALLACVLLDASEGGCGGEQPAPSCVRCVVERLFPDALEVRAACSRCMARLTPHMADCPEVCTEAGAAEDGGEACLACACAQAGATDAVSQCGASALCEESAPPQIDLVAGPYLGPTCLDTASACSASSHTLTPGCNEVTGGVSATITADGVLWTSDVCAKTPDQNQSVGVIAWPVGDTEPVPQDLDGFRGTTGLTVYGQSVAILGEDLAGAPILAGQGPDDDVFGQSDSVFSSGAKLYDRPVIIADTAGALYTLLKLNEGPADTLTLMSKPPSSPDWLVAPGVTLPLVGPPDGQTVPTDLQGVDLAVVSPSHVDVLLWRSGSAAFDPMAYYYRLDLLAETPVTSPTDFAVSPSAMEGIPLPGALNFPLFANEYATRIDVVAQSDAQGQPQWVPYVAHWMGSPPSHAERLVLLRRDDDGGDVAWTTVYEHADDASTAPTSQCPEPSPDSPINGCAITLTSERLLDIVGGDHIRMLVATHTQECKSLVVCDDAFEGCAWALDGDCTTLGGYGYTIISLTETGESSRTVGSLDVADAPIEQGSLVLDEDGALHVIVSLMKGDVVEVRHDALRCISDDCSQ